LRQSGDAGQARHRPGVRGTGDAAPGPENPGRDGAGAAAARMVAAPRSRGGHDQDVEGGSRLVSAPGEHLAGGLRGEAVADRGPATVQDRCGRPDQSPADHVPPTAVGRFESLRPLAGRVVAAEPWVAALAATVLLLAPNPLIWPAVLIGAL